MIKVEEKHGSYPDNKNPEFLKVPLSMYFSMKVEVLGKI